MRRIPIIQEPMKDTIKSVAYVIGASIFVFFVCVGFILFYWGNK